MTVTRFAPSPTGFLHIGNLRAALMNYLIARKAGGTFILRMDDTDPERSKPEFVEQIKTDLTWLGLKWDKIETQSSRLARYDETAEKLKAMGRLYECFESPTELDLKRKKQLNMGKPPVYDRAALALSDAQKDELRETRQGYWRFKLDQTRIDWTDGILGKISIDAASVSDPVLIRADGQVLYTIASVVDDTDMGITNVVRGSDHVTNTATQIQIMDALGFTPPEFAHHSLLTGPQGEALSKRLGTLALKDLAAEGIEPMAVLSHMARLGSSDGAMLTHEMQDLVEHFDISKFGAAPTKFDRDDLAPLTAKLFTTLPYADVKADVADAGVPDAIAGPFWEMARENMETRDDLAKWWALCRDGAEPLIEDGDEEFVKTAFGLLPTGDWSDQTWGEWTAAVKAETGRKGGGLFRPLRRALTGLDRGPEMGRLMPLLQKRPAT